MVDFLTLSGQSGFVGSAAAGAAFLNALQNSPLSGHYTAYNYYLQSAVDAGTLWGVEARSVARCTPMPPRFCCASRCGIDAAIAPYTGGRDLDVDQTRI